MNNTQEFTLHGEVPEINGYELLLNTEPSTVARIGLTAKAALVLAENVPCDNCETGCVTPAVCGVLAVELHENPVERFGGTMSTPLSLEVASAIVEARGDN